MAFIYGGFLKEKLHVAFTLFQCELYVGDVESF